MEYRKIINLLGETTKQPSKLRTRNWTEINDKWLRDFNDDDNENDNDDNNNDIKFKTSMIRSCLCNCSDV